MDTQKPEQKQNEQAQQVQATDQETQKKPATPAKRRMNWIMRPDIMLAVSAAIKYCLRYTGTN